MCVEIRKVVRFVRLSESGGNVRLVMSSLGDVGGCLWLCLKFRLEGSREFGAQPPSSKMTVLHCANFIS